MINTLRAEFRKVFTVRSTYLIFGFCVLLVIFFGFFISGYRINKVDRLNPATLAGDVTGAVQTLSIFAAIIAALLVTHEYRYNTIMYTLTASNSRSRVMLSKILVMTGFAIVFTAFFAVVSPILSTFGAHTHHITLVHQTFNYSNLLWRCLFYGWGYTMAGLLLAFLIRNQIGTVVTLFIAPATIEGLLSLLLKNNSVYMPFTSLSVVIGQGMNYRNTITPFHAMLVFSSYLIVGWIIAWILFLRRDAN